MNAMTNEKCMKDMKKPCNVQAFVINCFNYTTRVILVV